MPRRVQDIIPSNRRSIRDIPLSKNDVKRSDAAVREKPEKKKITEDEEPVKIHRDHSEQPTSSTASSEYLLRTNKRVETGKRRRSRFPIIAISLSSILIIAGVAYEASGHFAHAAFTLVPKVVPVSINGTYIVPSISTSSFGYELTTKSASASTTVPASAGAYVETKAQGTMTVYNSYSSNSQRLVAGTRFSSASGLVYRLTGSITVPGYTKSGSNILPGHITTTIVADQAGEKYNVSTSDDISDFKIVAYKGTSKYDSFYGRLTKDITGGFTGKKIVVSSSVLASTTSMLESQIAESLQKDIANTIPAGYVMYPTVYASSASSPTIDLIDSKTATVGITTTLYGIMLDEKSFAKFLAGSSSTDMFGSVGYITPDIGKLSITIANEKDFSPLKKTNLTIRVKGNFNLVGDIPTTTIRDAVAGLPLAKTNSVLNKYASAINLTKSAGEINPPWVSIVPTDHNRITISVKNP